jgi:hypothetical protein
MAQSKGQLFARLMDERDPVRLAQQPVMDFGRGM